MEYPGKLAYDSGTAARGWGWSGGDGGMAQKFTPPSYPANVDSAMFYIYQGGTTYPNFVCRIYDDNGPDNFPGDTLFQVDVPATAEGWYAVPVTGVTITEGSYYVAWHMTGDGSPWIGNCQTAPFSRNPYEFTGVWAHYRYIETDDPMIRSYVSLGGQPITVTLTPLNPPINIAAAGGTFDFTLRIQNNTANPYQFDGWTEAIMPNGNTYGPIIRRMGLTIPANGTIQRTATQNVPGVAPAGNYSYVGNVGEYPNNVVHSDNFSFLKLAGDGSTGGDQGWTCTGLFDDMVSTPAEYNFFNAYPNPFNPETKLSYNLPQASDVTLAIYDVSGRQVISLVNGWQGSGAYDITFDGSNLTSGVYFACIRAGEFNQTLKLLLLK
jgi:hypothetical protein